MYIDACVQQTDGNVVPPIMVWGAFHFRGKSELVIIEGPMNQTSKFTDLCSGKISCPGQGAPFAITVCWFKIMLLHTRHGPL